MSIIKYLHYLKELFQLSMFLRKVNDSSPPKGRPHHIGWQCPPDIAKEYSINVSRRNRVRSSVSHFQEILLLLLVNHFQISRQPLAGELSKQY